MNWGRRMLAVAGIETRRLLRSRIAFTLLVLVPAMQVLLFGYAIRPGGGAVAVAIAAAVPSDAAAVARQLGDKPGLQVVSGSLRPGEAAKAVRDHRALIGIEIPARPSLADPTAGVRPVRVVVDASNAVLTASAIPVIEAAYWQALAERGDVADTGPGYRIERLYNPDARTDWTFLPALIGVTVMISMMMLGTLSLAREREAGTWEVLLVLPIGATALLAGKLLPYVAMGSVQGALVLMTAVELFDLPARGAVVALLALLPLFAAAHLVLGYAIAARAVTQLAALQGAVAFYLPAMLLSGFLYPFETLPNWARLVGEAFPLTHFIRAARGVLLRGDDAVAVAVHAVPIMVFLGVALSGALALQTRRID
ncbi:MAG: ABC transporter permease [Sphingomonas sp.]